MFNFQQVEKVYGVYRMDFTDTAFAHRASPCIFRKS